LVRIASTPRVMGAKDKGSGRWNRCRILPTRIGRTVGRMPVVRARAARQFIQARMSPYNVIALPAPAAQGTEGSAGFDSPTCDARPLVTPSCPRLASQGDHCALRTANRPHAAFCGHFAVAQTIEQPRTQANRAYDSPAFSWPFARIRGCSRC
jgi:hypothetical protein